MAKSGILGKLTLGGCNHQFSWPRRSRTGEYYQVCVLCGDEYNYDWESMQRLGPKPPRLVAQSAAGSKANVRWHPRARRIRLFGPVRFREAGSDVWTGGEGKNISKSGLLFETADPLPDGTRIDVELDMPSEICGSIGRRVRCDAQVVRTAINLCAAQIFDYTFIDRIPLTERVPLPLHRRVRNSFRRSRRCSR